MEQEQNPIIQKLLDYAKDKTVITWDEINEIAGQDFINSPNMEEALKIFTERKIQVIETDPFEDEEQDDDTILEDDEGENSPDEDVDEIKESSSKRR